MNDILSKNIVAIIKDIKESKENVKEETVSIINRIFFSYSKANLKANIVLVLGGLSDIRAIVGTNLSKKNNIPIILYHISSKYKKNPEDIPNNMETTVIVLGNKPNLWKNKAQRYPTGRKNNKSTGSVSIGFNAASNIMF